MMIIPLQPQPLYFPPQQINKKNIIPNKKNKNMKMILQKKHLELIR